MNIETINDVAFVEGWGLYYNASSPNMEVSIEKVDELGLFNTDAEAIQFVEKLASQGSHLHAQALKIHAK